jgi:hypothetical protein
VINTGTPITVDVDFGHKLKNDSVVIAFMRDKRIKGFSLSAFKKVLF